MLSPFLCGVLALWKWRCIFGRAAGSKDLRRSRTSSKKGYSLQFRMRRTLRNRMINVGDYSDVCTFCLFLPHLTIHTPITKNTTNSLNARQKRFENYHSRKTSAWTLLRAFSCSYGTDHTCFKLQLGCHIPAFDAYYLSWWYFNLFKATSRSSTTQTSTFHTEITASSLGLQQRRVMVPRNQIPSHTATQWPIQSFWLSDDQCWPLHGRLTSRS